MYVNSETKEYGLKAYLNKAKALGIFGAYIC